jgi:hypothetical protein
MRFSTLGFFHQTIPPRALIYGQKPFRIWLRIRRENRSIPLFCQSSSMICTFSRNYKYVMFTYLLLFCYGFPLKGMGANNSFREWSCGVMKDSAVSLTPWDLILQSHWHRRIWALGVNDIAESASAVWLRLWNLLQKCPSQILRCHWYHGIRTFQTIISILSANTKPHAKQLNPMNQGPRGDCLMKKNRGSKISGHCPFKKDVLVVSVTILNVYFSSAVDAGIFLSHYFICAQFGS